MVTAARLEGMTPKHLLWFAERPWEASLTVKVGRPYVGGSESVSDERNRPVENPLRFGPKR